MTLSGLLHVVADDPDLRQALDQVSELPALGGDLIAPASLRPVLVAALAGQPEQVTLAVTATAREAEELAAALGSLLGEDRVGYFPAWETLPHERLSPRSDTSGQRLAILRRLAHPDPSDVRSGPLQVVTTPVRSLLQPLGIVLPEDHDLHHRNPDIEFGDIFRFYDAPARALLAMLAPTSRRARNAGRRGTRRVPARA